MTWLADLPPDNTLLAGEWWAEGGEMAQVSVEQGVAADLGLELGDKIEFSSGGLRWQAQVTSLRGVRWENLRANFYMIFRPGDLAGLPYTWFASFHLEPAQKPALVALNRAFPGLSLIELDVLINQVQSIIDQLSLLLQTLLGFVLAAGLTIVLAALHTSWRERLHEGAVWRVLGAGRARLRARQLAEFACLGILAGGLGATAAEAGMMYLSRQWFALPYTPSIWSFTALPLGLALLLMAVGWRGSRQIAEAAPLAALRDE